MNKEIIRCLYTAQKSSDARKGIFVLPDIDNKNKIFAWKGYPSKDAALLRVLQLISKQGERDFTFYVTTISFVDNRGINTASYVVYFNYILNGMKYQISTNPSVVEAYCKDQRDSLLRK